MSLPYNLLYRHAVTKSEDKKCRREIKLELCLAQVTVRTATHANE